MKVRSAQQRHALERLALLPDEDIDLSDQPEILDWSNAERGKFYRPLDQVQLEFVRQDRKAKAVKP